MSVPENPVQPREGRPPHLWQGMRGRWCAGCQAQCRSDALCACCAAWEKHIAELITEIASEEKGTDNG